MDKEIKIITDAILEIIEDSNVISDIRNNLFDIEERQKYDHDYAIEHTVEKVNDLDYDINDEINNLESDINDKLDDLSERIDELRDCVDDLIKENDNE